MTETRYARITVTLDVELLDAGQLREAATVELERIGADDPSWLAERRRSLIADPCAGLNWLVDLLGPVASLRQVQVLQGSSRVEHSGPPVAPYSPLDRPEGAPDFTPLAESLATRASWATPATVAGLWYGLVWCHHELAVGIGDLGESVDEHSL